LTSAAAISAAIDAVDSDLTQDGTELTVVVTTGVVWTVWTAPVVVTAGFATGAGVAAAALTTENPSKPGDGAGDADGAAAATEAAKDCVCVMKFSNDASGSNEPKSSVPLSV
jgi:hypothetical protein